MIIVGIDEAGRGCWAGPLVAAAVILAQPIIGLNDSKQLSVKKREQLAREIKASAYFGLGWVEAQEIDDIGLTLATSKAMRAALDQITNQYDEVIIDGNLNYLADTPKTSTLVRGDSLVPEISAASILAKVARDEYMHKIALDYPEYQFEKHVGYGTALHFQLLKQHGVSKLHRLSYKPLQALLKVGDV